MSSSSTIRLQPCNTRGVRVASRDGMLAASSFNKSSTICNECSSRETASRSDRASRTSRTNPFSTREALERLLPSSMQSAVMALCGQKGLAAVVVRCEAARPPDATYKLSMATLGALHSEINSQLGHGQGTPLNDNVLWQNPTWRKRKALHPGSLEQRAVYSVTGVTFS